MKTMNITVGTDLVEIARLRNVLEQRSPGMAKRLYTDQEWQYCQSQAQPWTSLAARFAAKEALRKIFGQWGNEGINWRETEVAVGTGGAPSVRLHGRARELAGDYCFALSLAHTDQLAQAFCVAWRDM